MTGIVNVYSRSPALIAQSSATIDALSGGRFTLGLGSSGAQVIEGWHRVPFVKPLGRTRDTSRSAAGYGPATSSPTTAAQ